MVDGPTALPEWAQNQRPHLKPLVVGRFGVSPPWCDPVGEIPLSIDPGPTFGHGAHPTTQLVLAEIDRLIEPGHTVLDAGCGSGVLGIAAACAGASSVTGIDNDPNAVAWTDFNAKANQVEVQASTRLLSSFTKPFDLVVANVLPSVQKIFARDLCRLVSGHLVLSGIPADQADNTTALYSGHFTETQCTHQDGWVAIVLTP